GKLRLTPRAVTRMQRRALMEVFANLREGQREGHEKVTPGQGGERIDGTKPYQFGDPVSELDLHQTLHNALSRHGLPAKKWAVGSGRERRTIPACRLPTAHCRLAFTSTNTTSSSTCTRASRAVRRSCCWT